MHAVPPAPRFSLKLPMRYRVQGEKRWRETTTLNVSSSGAVFLASELLEPNRQLELEIHMPSLATGASKVLAESEVVRQKSGTGGLLTVVRHLRYEIQGEAATTATATLA